MDEISPCPFCGAIPRIGIRRNSNGDYCILWAEHDRDCVFNSIGSDGNLTGLNHGSLIRKWNKRYDKRRKKK